MTEQGISEMLRLAGMDVTDAFKHTGTGRRARLYKIAQEATRSVVLGLHIDLEFTLAFSTAYYLLRTSGKLQASDDPTGLAVKMSAFLTRRLGFTGLGELAVWLGIASDEHLRVILDLNGLRNRYAHSDSPSAQDGSGLGYRGRPLVEPVNLRRLKDDVEAVATKLQEQLTDGAEGAASADDGVRFKVTALAIPPDEW